MLSYFPELPMSPMCLMLNHSQPSELKIEAFLGEEVCPMRSNMINNVFFPIQETKWFCRVNGTYEGRMSARVRNMWCLCNMMYSQNIILVLADNLIWAKQFKSQLGWSEGVRIIFRVLENEITFLIRVGNRGQGLAFMSNRYLIVVSYELYCG